MTFDNALLDIETNEDNIEDAFDAAFPDWKFSIDKTEEIKSSNSKTKIDCHFLQRDNFDPVLKTEVAAKIDEVYTNITRAFNDMDLILDREHGFDFGIGDGEDASEDEANVVQVVFIIISTVLGIMFIFLGIAYFIRVRQ